MGGTPRTLEYPKSQIFNRGAGRPSKSVFSSFRSRWHTPCVQKILMEMQRPSCLF